LHSCPFWFLSCLFIPEARRGHYNIYLLFLYYSKWKLSFGITLFFNSHYNRLFIYLLSILLGIIIHCITCTKPWKWAGMYLWWVYQLYIFLRFFRNCYEFRANITVLRSTVCFLRISDDYCRPGTVPHLNIIVFVLNVCKPQEYPGFLRSYANRKIDLIKKKRKKNPFFFLQKLTTVLLPYQTFHKIT
jgi:hypothetical protein